MNKDKLVHYSKEKRSENVEPPAGWDFKCRLTREFQSSAEYGPLSVFGKTCHYRDLEMKKNILKNKAHVLDVGQQLA